MADYPSQPSLPLAPVGDLAISSSSRITARKKASTACSACRARRSKCTGGVPCQACISHRTECVKDINDDGRRRVAIKRRIEGYEEDRNFLELLIAALRHGNDDQVSSLIQHIRSNSSRHNLRDMLETMVRTLDPSKLPTSGPYQRSFPSPEAPMVPHRPRTGGINDLINPPIQVPARPWTMVTHDNDYVSHLISLWFTWMQPWLRWVEEIPFIEAMRSQDLNNPFCAPYLVSSILAEACLLDTKNAKEQEHNKEMQQRFMAEAQAGIQAEHGKPSLALIQAMGVQWTHLYLNGQDTQGRLDFNSQSFLVKNMDKWRARMAKMHEDTPVLLEEIDTSMQYIEWTLYTLNFFNLADCYTGEFLVKPTRACPGTNHQVASDSAWMPYPQQKSSHSQFHPDCHYQAWIQLAKHMEENESLSARRREGINEDDRLRRLIPALEQDWPESLPQCLQLHTQAMPHVLVLHALHNWVILVLAKQAAAAEAGHPGEPTIVETPQSHNRYFWKQMSTSRALAIAAIVQTYRRNWGVNYFPALILQPVSLSLLTLLEDIQPLTNHEAFINLSKVLVAVSRKFRVAKGVMKVIRNTARAKGIGVPDEAELMFQSHKRKSSSMESEASPPREDGSSSENDITMDYLLEKWMDLDLDEDAGG